MKWKTKQIPNYLEADSVIKIKNGISSEVPFEIIGDYLSINDFDSDAEYHLRYRPRVERITKNTPNTTIIDIEDRIAAYIPYYIFGELFKHDEPNMAAEMRNEYEQHCITTTPVKETVQTDVERWF